MQETLRQDGLIHRRAMSGHGRAQCGAEAPEYGWLNLSNTGVGVTCPRCNPAPVPAASIEELIAEAAARFRAAQETP